MSRFLPLLGLFLLTAACTTSSEPQDGATDGTEPADAETDTGSGMDAGAPVDLGAFTDGGPWDGTVPVDGGYPVLDLGTYLDMSTLPGTDLGGFDRDFGTFPIPDLSGIPDLSRTPEPPTPLPSSLPTPAP